MSLLSKRKLIVVAVVILAVIVAGLWVWMKGRKTQQLIQEGNAALRARDWNTATERFSQAKLRLPNDPDVLYGLAKANLELALLDYRAGRAGYVNRLRRVEGQLSQLRRVAADRPEAALVQGEVLFYLNRPEKALQAYQEMLKWNRDSFEAHLGMGQSLFALSEQDPSRRPQAIEALQKALQAGKKSETALRLLAELYLVRADRYVWELRRKTKASG